MNQVTKWLAAGPLITDGAWGTELQKRGLAAGEVPDSWNLEHPERVEEVGVAYRAAGSRVILTNTFRSNPIALAASGLEGATEALNRAGVAISRKAAAGEALVFASIGPTGKLLMTGDVKPDEVRAAFARQAAALAEAGADALVMETMSDVEEAALALAAARETGLPVIVSFAFDSGRKHDRTMTGATPEQAARVAQEGGAAAVGANCGAGPDAFAEICRRLRAACDLPVWLKPNAGLPAVVDAQVLYSASPEDFAASAMELLAAGASFVGGCCGTSPEFIRALAKRAGACVSS
ncbi:MAG: homocysteine S-methyltransferase family protein [Bryobacteraceae bacterium]|jgi:methionine synthase I (cobalamin-dependent)